MPNHAYPDPHRPTLDDLDLDSLTTDQLVSLVQSHCKGHEPPAKAGDPASVPIVARITIGRMTSALAAMLIAALVSAFTTWPQETH